MEDNFQTAVMAAAGNLWIAMVGTGVTSPSTFPPAHSPSLVIHPPSFIVSIISLPPKELGL
jgi:hypothetical protein